MTSVISSPIRWTGSKRKMLNEMLTSFDSDKKIYIEPFLGSATVLINSLNLNLYDDYYVNDINNHLIDFFVNLRDSTDTLLFSINEIIIYYNSLNTLDDKSLFFYKMRKAFNSNTTLENKSSIFWFLMKTCFNGVYRINKSGQFNVPFGKKISISFNVEQALNISKLINNVRFFSHTYNDFLTNINLQDNLKNSFIYCDPPYIPQTVSSKNQKMYTSNHFDHFKFIQFINQLSIERKPSIMISMSESRASNEIYNLNNFEKIPLTEIIRVVNPKRLLKASEVAYLNYSPNNFSESIMGKTD
ncbi:DNA adenine methylase [Enterococcus quebecensis]|uniref:Site-specific DNA-methyltransferase (adenine-specific) n=1 Tax=Enterococcus quebecensis TaxID=903983 RepID=A0A1E5GWF9_9ENTE|nr:Dam family site-specific DNA-(adenine-N6)-methyltransferase [Enterococcus quebecensis]OEG17051.1 hypothetical protein BCR23_03320 [Enterococcus quebecensis]OJG75426.1 DNA adenine methylase [Enterococcus quebecensis]